MNSFDFNPITRLVFGAGAVERAGELACVYGGSRVLLVSDPGIAAAGHVTPVENSLRRAGCEVFTFTGAEENPTTHTVERAVHFARPLDIDFIVGLGGGSSMDTAKGANFILTNGGRMQDYWGLGRAREPMFPMIAIPTTAGTGSETQSFALISDPETHVKMACGDPKAACRTAILDPALTLSLPRDVAAVSGIDAVSHALETYVTTRRNPISQMYSRQAWMLLSENFARIFDDPSDIEARGAMLVGSSLAGLAIENSMLGAAHSCANPLTARFGAAHGRAIGVMLPHVIRRNGARVSHLYAELLSPEERNGTARGAMNGAAAGALAEKVVVMLKRAGLPMTLRECGVSRDALGDLAEQATQQWTAQFNPVSLTRGDFLELYECAY